MEFADFCKPALDDMISLTEEDFLKDSEELKENQEG